MREVILANIIKMLKILGVLTAMMVVSLLVYQQMVFYNYIIIMTP